MPTGKAHRTERQTASLCRDFVVLVRCIAQYIRLREILMKFASSTTLMVIGLASALAAPMVQAEAPADTAAPVASDGLRVVRDAVTGALRAPTAAELATMSAAERTAPSAALVVRTAPNGMKSARLTEEYMVQLNASHQADGKLAVSHSEGGLEQPAAPAVALPTE